MEMTRNAYNLSTEMMQATKHKKTKHLITKYLAFALQDGLEPTTP